MARRKCSFNDNLAKEFPFIEKDDKFERNGGECGTGRVHCKTCDVRFSIANSGRSQLLQHVKTEKHKKAAARGTVGPNNDDDRPKCLICGEGTEDDLLKTSGLEGKSAVVLFLVNRLLMVSKDQCAEYLRYYGHPGEWFVLCGTCTTKTNEAIDTVNQINRLQDKVDKIKVDLQSQVETVEEERACGELALRIRRLVTSKKNDISAPEPVNTTRGRRKTKRLITESATNIKKEFRGDANASCSAHEGVTVKVKTEIQDFDTDIIEEAEALGVEQNFAEEHEEDFTEMEGWLSPDKIKKPRTDSSPMQIADSELQQGDENAIAELSGGEGEGADANNSSCDENGNTAPEDALLKKKSQTPPCRRGNSVIQNLSCSKCHRTFDTKRLCRRHAERCLGVKKGYPCDQCEQVCAAPENLERHVRTFHLSKDCIVCKSCNVTFNSVRYFTRHIEEGGIASPCNDLAIPCFQKETCKFLFSSKEALDVHMKTRHTSLTLYHPFKCEEQNCGCGRSFPNAGHKKQHEDRHKFKGTKKCICERCGKRFDTMPYLRDHIKHIHVNGEPGGKRFPCPICGKEFTSSRKVWRHKQIHMSRSESNYVCTVCGKSFKLQCHLKSHTWAHDPERHLKYARYKNKPPNPKKSKSMES